MTETTGPDNSPTSRAAAERTDAGDIAALAKGGRTNFLGFLLRLAARLPFLFIAGRLYGAEALGRFASALVIVELVAMLCTIGEKRGLAERLSEGEDLVPSHIVFDGLLVAFLFGSAAALLLYLVPAPMFPSGQYTELDRLIVLAIPALAMTEIALAAQAYKFDIAATVRARAVVEPWTISIMAGAFFLLIPSSGLSMAFVASVMAAALTAFWPFLRSYGLPRGWTPSAKRLRRRRLHNKLRHNRPPQLNKRQRSRLRRQNKRPPSRKPLDRRRPHGPKRRGWKANARRPQHSKLPHNRPALSRLRHNRTPPAPRPPGWRPSVRSTKPNAKNACGPSAGNWTRNAPGATRPTQRRCATRRRAACAEAGCSGWRTTTRSWCATRKPGRARSS